MKDLLNLGVSVAVPTVASILTGNPGISATSTAFTLGTKGTKTSKVIRDESLSGALFGTFAHYTTTPTASFSTLGKGAYQTVWPLAANPAYLTGDHLVKERTPRGLYTKIKEKNTTQTKNAYKSVVPIVVAASMLLPSSYIVPVIAGTSYLFRRFVAGGKEKEETDKTSFFDATTSVTYKGVANTAKGMYNSLTAIGSGLSSTLGSIIKYSPPKPAEPAPAGAH